ncbi:hypothetical protein AB3Y40_09350 [Yoonia sp. R2331]|uniref:hypothetical protein n=1 Tax=Yoonia sp. R2331 TaxID=3237238 RepID=UPI0034E48273
MSESSVTFLCVPKSPLNVDTFIDIAHSTAQEYHVKDGWDVNIVVLGEARESIRTRKASDWADLLRQNWANSKEIRLFGFDGNVHTEVSFRRMDGILDIDVPLRDGDDSQTVEAAFLKTWDCVPMSGDPWRYRSTGVVYRPGNWSTANLAKGIENTLANWGPPEIMSLDDGFISYEHRDVAHVERLQGATTLPDFLDLLRRFDARTNMILNIGMSVRGPAYVSNGSLNGLGFGLYVSHKPAPVTVEIRSSIPAAELNRRLEPMADALGFGKPVPAIISGSQTSGGQPQFDKRPWVTLILAPLILAAIGLLTWQTYFLAYPDYNTNLSAPLLTDQTTTATPGPLVVEWFLQPDPKGLRRRIFDAPATVDVLRDGTIVGSFVGQGRASVAVAPGRNTLIVRPADTSASPLTFQVDVADPAAN